MEDKTMFKEIKERLKSYAKEIRTLKNRRKETCGSEEDKILQLKYHFRHIHIAFCETRGRTREEIEKPAQNNLPNENYIKKIKEEILQKVQENAKIVCSS
jgi:hypothetical protein